MKNQFNNLPSESETTTTAQATTEEKQEHFTCGLCHGRGYHTEYGETYPCGLCTDNDGRGRE